MDWKPDKNKNCIKCIHHDTDKEYSEYPPFELIGQTDYCTLEDQLREDKNYHYDWEFNEDGSFNSWGYLTGLIGHIETCRNDMAENKKEAEAYTCFLANICPLYEEVKQ
nr:hypothetical protein [Methanobrevibacter arboriphilus]